MGIEQFTRARDRLLGVINADADLATVLEDTVAAMHAVTRFSWCAVMTVDSETLLPTGGVVEGFSPEACAPFWDSELLAPGFNKFIVLARSSDPVATLVSRQPTATSRGHPSTASCTRRSRWPTSYALPSGSAPPVGGSPYSCAPTPMARFPITRSTRSGGWFRSSPGRSVALAFTHLTVDDVDEALGFYRDALGLAVLNDVSAGEGRWVTVGADTQPDVTIVLSLPHVGRSPHDGDAMQELLVKGSLPMKGFSTDDMDGLFERIAASGAEVLQEPIDQPWGPRDCAFRDPSGNTVRITAHARSSD